MKKGIVSAGHDATAAAVQHRRGGFSGGVGGGALCQSFGKPPA